MDLSLKRKKILDLYKLHEQMPQSSFHASAIEAGHAKMSDRPIAFLCDDEVVVIEGCVKKVVDGCRAFLMQASMDPEKWAKRRAHEPAVENAWGKIERLANSNGSTVEIRMGQGAWNGILLGLNEVNCDVVLTDGSYE